MRLPSPRGHGILVASIRKSRILEMRGRPARRMFRAEASRGLEGQLADKLRPDTRRTPPGEATTARHIPTGDQDPGLLARCNGDGDFPHGGPYAVPRTSAIVQQCRSPSALTNRVIGRLIASLSGLIRVHESLSRFFSASISATPLSPLPAIPAWVRLRS